MAAGKFRIVLRHLLPARGLGPRACAVNGVWLLAACIGLTYAALSPNAFLDGMGLLTYNTLFMTAAGPALAPMLATIAGLWLMYAYLYALTGPILRPMGRQSPVPHLAVASIGGKVFRALRRLAQASAFLLGLIGRESAPYVALSLQCSRIRLGVPSHLAVGWRAGTHPQVLYATDIR